MCVNNPKKNQKYELYEYDHVHTLIYHESLIMMYHVRTQCNDKRVISRYKYNVLYMFCYTL